ncbi:MAG: peptide chain release factor N(5)-glutamine methyltransferase [Gemmatimonadetes bacterium]|nr:peptide chain release factor N(5)-glutamine methyltransferase [Gemmatimonadota bacterium]
MVEQALELARKAASLLRERGFAQARLEAELLLAGVLGLERLQLYLQFDRPVTEAELERFRAHVRRRLKREPVQYILGEAAFRQLRLQVDRRVLIPRPETEILVGEVLRWAAGRSAPVRALEVGTGSGAIALSLAEEGGLEVVATDVSAAALEVARANIDAHCAAGRVELRPGPLWEPVRAAERFDVVVSNPPYVATGEFAALQPEVKDWEPRLALAGGDDGLDVVRGIVAGAPAHMVRGGLLALEIGATQGPAVLAMLETVGGAWSAARVIKDLAGRERVVLAEAAQERAGNG